MTVNNEVIRDYKLFNIVTTEKTKDGLPAYAVVNKATGITECIATALYDAIRSAKILEFELNKAENFDPSTEWPEDKAPHQLSLPLN